MPEQIAADARRRPIGVVIADICRDLGILPNHPLWRELSLLIIRHGGSLAGLLKETSCSGCCHIPLRAPGERLVQQTSPPPSLLTGTGPP